MAITVQNIIDGGFAKSAAARPESMMATGELIDRIGQCLREVFLILARENPEVLAVAALVPFNGSGWPRPADCLRVLRILANIGTIATPAIAAGAEVAVLPYNDLGFNGGAPALAELGQQFVPSGQARDPSNGTLTIIYARAPQQPTATTDAIDPLFPEVFSNFLKFDVAAYLATKDAREQDAQTFLAFKSADLLQIVQWARGQTYSVVQRFPLVTAPLTNTDGGKQSAAEA